MSGITYVLMVCFLLIYHFHKQIDGCMLTISSWYHHTASNILNIYIYIYNFLSHFPYLFFSFWQMTYSFSLSRIVSVRIFKANILKQDLAWNWKLLWCLLFLPILVWPKSNCHYKSVIGPLCDLGLKKRRRK